MHAKGPNSPEELYPHVLAALRAWHKPGAQDLLDSLLLFRLRLATAANNTSADAARRITNELLAEHVKKLADEDPLGSAKAFCLCGHANLRPGDLTALRSTF